MPTPAETPVPVIPERRRRDRQAPPIHSVEYKPTGSDPDSIYTLGDPSFFAQLLEALVRGVRGLRNRKSYTR